MNQASPAPKGSKFSEPLKGPEFLEPLRAPEFSDEPSGDFVTNTRARPDFYSLEEMEGCGYISLLLSTAASARGNFYEGEKVLPPSVARRVITELCGMVQRTRRVSSAQILETRMIYGSTKQRVSAAICLTKTLTAYDFDNVLSNPEMWV